MSYILGVSIGHDSGAAILQDGVLRAAVNEERFTGRKHYGSYPFRSMEYCLDALDIDAHDVDAIAVPSESGHPALDLLLDEYRTTNVSQDPTRARERIRHELRRPDELLARVMRRSGNALLESGHGPVVPDYVFDLEFASDIEVRTLNHHEAHASSAYFSCGSEDALVVTADGIGDDLSTTVWDCQGGEMRALRRWGREGSLGWFFGIVTEALGWWIGNGEGKTMGLASYGKFDQEVADALGPYLPTYEDGELVSEGDFSQPSTFEIYDTYHWSFEEAKEVAELADEFGRKNVAATAQTLLEEQIVNLIAPWHERTSHDTIATAGGVFLNVRVNHRVIRQVDPEAYFIFPNAGDGGLPTGAAFTAHRFDDKAFLPTELGHVYLGPDIDESLPEDLDKRSLSYESPDDIVDRGVELLTDGKIVAWCRGRMEYGPRALGNRSILIDPTRKDSMDRVNQSVKFRESWRPFAPSIVEEAVDEYLVDPVYDPYMITSFDVREEKREEIPAVTHVDGTTRPQVVRKSVNEPYWRIINRFGEVTGTPVLLNTSFNLSGDPIVRTSKDAIHTFFNSGLDALVLDEYVLTK